MAAVTGRCRVGGVDLSALGWRFVQAEGVRAMPRMDAGRRAVPGRAGLRRTGRRTPAARTIVLQGRIDARTPAEIEAVRDAVIAAASGGPVEIECATRPGVVWVGELVSDAVTHFGPQLLAHSPTHALTFECVHPLGLSTEPSVVGWSSESDPAVIECGTAASDLTVRVFGPATNPAVILRDCRGAEIARMTFNVTLGADDYLVASSETYRVTLVQSGVATDGAGLLADGSRFFAADPAYDADVTGEAWPTIHSTSGTGETSYRRAWL